MDSRHDRLGDDADVALLTLLTGAHRVYLTAIREALVLAGCDDMPTSGYRVIRGVARGTTRVHDLAALWGVSKQAASRLIETLVTRSYVARGADPDDGRRAVLGLTERGWRAGKAIRGAIDELDASLQTLVDPEQLRATRVTLRAITEGLGEGAVR